MMKPTVRVCLACLSPFLVSALLAGCGGGGGGATAPASGPSGAAPEVNLPTATSLGPAGATLNGNVTANGLPTECWFEYGTDPALATRDNTARLPVDSGATGQSVARTVSGLASGTVHYFRICASNSRGTARSPIVGFTTRACLECHGGADGTQPGVNGAPVVTMYWPTSGHGRTFSSRGTRGVIACEECHDVCYLSSADHKTDGTAGSGPPPANVNTLSWPGKTDNGSNAPTANTSHLKQAYFPSSATKRYEYARAFDRKCGDPAAGCHRFPPHNQHPVVPAGSVDPADNVLRFGDFNTVLDPKAYSWYPESPDYRTDFYKSPSPWEIGDLTTNAAGVGPDNSIRYGTCVTCHDPHGTGATDQKVGGGNAMVRGNWTESAQFCNGACHTTRTPP